MYSLYGFQISEFFKLSAVHQTIHTKNYFILLLNAWNKASWIQAESLKDISIFIVYFSTSTDWCLSPFCLYLLTYSTSPPDVSIHSSLFLLWPVQLFPIPNHLIKMWCGSWWWILMAAVDHDDGVWIMVAFDCGDSWSWTIIIINKTAW